MSAMRRALVSVRNPSVELGAVVVDGDYVALQGNAATVLRTLVQELGQRPAAQRVIDQGWANGAGLYFADAAPGR